MSHIDILPTVVAYLVGKDAGQNMNKILGLLDGKNMLEIQSNDRYIISESLTKAEHIINKSYNKSPSPGREVFFRIARGENISVAEILGELIELNLMLTSSGDKGELDTFSLTISNPQTIEYLKSNNNKRLRYLLSRANRIINKNYDFPTATSYSLLRKTLRL